MSGAELPLRNAGKRRVFMLRQAICGIHNTYTICRKSVPTLHTPVTATKENEYRATDMKSSRTISVRQM